MTKRKPIIGVTGYDVSEEEGYGGKLRGNIGQGFSVVGHDYLRCVEKAGGIPVGLPILSDRNLDVVSSLDAIVLTGGRDLDPRLFGESVDHRMGRLCPERDHFELKFIDVALKAAAIAPDGVIEAMVHRDLGNILAVQWHPEMMSVKYAEGLVPFQWLIKAIQEHGYVDCLRQSAN